MVLFSSLFFLIILINIHKSIFADSLYIFQEKEIYYDGPQSSESFSQTVISRPHLRIYGYPLLISMNFKQGEFLDFFYVLYSTLLHLPPLRFNCVGGSWEVISISSEKIRTCIPSIYKTTLTLTCIYHIYQPGMKSKPVKLPEKATAGKRSLSIIHAHCRLCI
jgi:hypothetical protein